MYLKQNVLLSDRESILRSINRTQLSPHPLIKGSGSGSTYSNEMRMWTIDPFTSISKVFLDLSGGCEITDMWFNVYKPGDCVLPHNHLPQSEPFLGKKFKVGAYYFKKSKDGGNLVINDKEVNISENDFVIFDACDNHWSLKNMSSDDRIVFSANILME